jgi:hypothetical protein
MRDELVNVVKNVPQTRTSPKQKLEALEKKYDNQFKVVFEAKEGAARYGKRLNRK